MRLFKIIFAIIIATGMFISCDKIEEPYKQKAEKPTKNQNVLIEDYTGNHCTFCPDAHRIAADLIENYGEENLIVVAMHAGFQSIFFPPKYGYDFTTDDGDEYNAEYAPQEYPTGVINKNYDETGEHKVSRAQWGAVVDTLFQQDSPIDITIDANYEGRKINCNIDIDFFSDLPEASSLLIWITEDSIISGQDDAIAEGSYVADYVHNHVFRGSINGLWGEALPQASYTEGSTETMSVSNFEMKDDWVAEQLAIVAFVFDTETKSIIQVSKFHLHE